MTGATLSIPEKLAHRLAVDARKQSRRRERLTASGLVCSSAPMTAAAYTQLGELLVHFNLPNYNAALTKVLELMSGQTPPYPKVKPGDPAGAKVRTYWLPDGAIERIEALGYKDRLHAITSLVSACHEQQLGAAQ